MNVLVVFLGLGFAVIGFAAAVCIILPLPRIRLVTRFRALGVLILACVAYVAVGYVLGEYGLYGRPGPWGWLVVLAAGFGILRFVLADRRRKPVAIRTPDKPSAKVPVPESPAEVARPDITPVEKDSEPRPAASPPVGAPQRTSAGTPVNGGTPAEVVSHPAPAAPRRGQVRRVPRTGTHWIDPGDDVRVAGRHLGGMVYVGSETLQDTWEHANNALIDPRLPVARLGTDLGGESLPYWPSYRDINPRARATYLDWLAGGRSDPRIGPGYVFLYFYGLERRFFQDAPTEEERRLLVAEVSRLHEAHGENHSVRRYLGVFLNAAAVVLEPHGEHKPPFARSAHELPLLLRVAIGQMVKSGQPLSADWLLEWYVAHPDTRLRTAVTRALAEFRVLFMLLFDDRFPEGLLLRAPKRRLRAVYRAASGTFEADLRSALGDMPDIAALSRPVTVAREIADEAAGALQKYSRFLGRNPNGRDTIEAHALLPELLWPHFPSAGMEALRHWAQARIDDGGLVPVEQVVERLEGATPDKLGKRQLTGAADALARLSIGLAPDPRFALRSPRIGEPVVLFRLPAGLTKLEDVSETYKNLLFHVAMGSFIAQADGTVAAKEREVLEDRIDTSGLRPDERARLHANLTWMLEIPPDVGLFRRRLRDAPEGTRHVLGQAALALAAVDGVIDPNEIKAIERLYSAIGLPTEGIYADLHALTARSEPVTVVAPGQSENVGYAVPSPPPEDHSVVLDAERVAALVADTAKVSSVLGEIFDDGTDAEEEDLEESLDGEGSDFPGLDAQHAAFLDELLTRTQWDESEFAALARQFRLMEEGALETVNEWAFEQHDGLLIEAYEGYEINPDIAAELRS
ncbi:MAG: hypothetical protein F4Y06_00440 [Rhodospirillales bacterium]|nr:hypothetical protein [Rhodospirillales bacterium]